MSGCTPVSIETTGHSSFSWSLDNGAFGSNGTATQNVCLAAGQHSIWLAGSTYPSTLRLVNSDLLLSLNGKDTARSVSFDFEVNIQAQLPPPAHPPPLAPPPAPPVPLAVPEPPPPSPAPPCTVVRIETLTQGFGEEMSWLIDGCTGCPPCNGGQCPAPANPPCCYSLTPNRAFGSFQQLQQETCLSWGPHTCASEFLDRSAQQAHARVSRQTDSPACLSSVSSSD